MSWLGDEKFSPWPGVLKLDLFLRFEWLTLNWVPAQSLLTACFWAGAGYAVVLTHGAPAADSACLLPVSQPQALEERL